MASKKRKLADTLTGGTGDTNPQTYTIHEAITEVTKATAAFPLPIPRFGSFGKDRSVVFELLGVHWHMNDLPTRTAAQGYIVLRTALTTNPDNPAPAPLAADPRVLATFYRAWNVPATGTAISAITEYDIDEVSDLTDEAGHGILIATDNIYLAVYNDAAGPTLLTDLSVSLRYRMKEVSLQEYIGIVQSQQ